MSSDCEIRAVTFADNLAALPESGHLVGVELTDPAGGQWRIENVPGSQGSVRVYAWLLGKYALLDASAATEGLVLYAEHTTDARAHPGKHPNIDRLLAILADGRAWRGRILAG